jgi:adenine-specific DNA methylase
VVTHLSVDERTKNRIQLAIVGAAEMAGYLCRWDRFHPKAFEALANHHFSALGLAVETNLLASRGRGTIRRRLLASVRAARWIESHTRKCVVKMHGGHCMRQDVPESITLVCGTSAHQLLPGRCVDLVITDPPYFDAVQYAELAALFLTWAKVINPQAKNWTPHAKLEAVPNATRGVDWLDYQSKLCMILSETARTLNPRASVVITYHSTDFRGWASLGTAIHAAGLQIVSIAVATSENGTDHPKRGKLAFTQDLVLECRRSRKKHPAVHVVTPARTPAARELIAAGRALAVHGGNGAEMMTQAFEEDVSRLKYRRIRVAGILRKANNHGEQ